MVHVVMCFVIFCSAQCVVYVICCDLIDVIVIVGYVLYVVLVL